MGDDTLLGKQLANYRVEQSLGTNGIGLHYAGTNIMLKRPVIITVLDPRYRNNRTYSERWVRDSRTVATWRHENVVKIQSIGNYDQFDYVVADAIDGVDLGTTLAQHNAAGWRLPQATVLHIGHAVAKALDFAHSRGLIHRDVKPANVILAADQRVLLTNFGLATDLQASLLRGDVGPTHYIAPEQARRSADATARSDIYALGMLVYEMLTGALPSKKVAAYLSSDVLAVLDQARSTAPAERYPSGAALMTALEIALGIRQPVVQQVQHAARSEPAPVAVPQGTPPAPQPPIIDKGRPLTKPPRSPGRENLIGQFLDAYRLEELLGRGGMANVYRGIDIRLKRTVAIKVIRAPFRSRAEYATRFKREAQAIAQLEHPNIVRLYQYGDANGLLYMAMEYIEGKDLHQVLEEMRTDPTSWPPRARCRLVREICTALDYAHSKGMIHRDVKPTNILIDKRGRAVLSDFGLVLLTDVGTGGTTFGSPQFISPEQIVSSASAVPQSDLYGLGVIVYRMWTGRLPFDDPDPMVLAMQHMSETPQPPREIEPAISLRLEQVILKALAKEPTERYASGDALADALEIAVLGVRIGGEHMARWNETVEALPPLEPTLTLDHSAQPAAAANNEIEITLRVPPPPAMLIPASSPVMEPLVSTLPVVYSYAPRAAPKRRIKPAWILSLLGMMALMIIVVLML